MIRQVETWMFNGYKVRILDLAIYRVLYSVVMLVLVVPVAPWLLNTPAAYFSPPPGPAAFFQAFPPPWFLFSLNSLLAVSLAGLLVGWHTKVASLSVAFTLFSLNTWAYALGKIDHDILWVVAPLVLAWSPWGEAISIDSLREKRPGSLEILHGSWPHSLLALIISLAMFTAGWDKLQSGWLDLATHSTYGHFVQNYHVTGRHTWLGTLLLPIDRSWFWEPQDWLAVTFEVGFILACWSQRIMRVAVALACLFHVGVWLLFDIVFACNVLAYGAFVSYSLAVPRSLMTRNSPAGNSAWVGVAVFLVALGIGMWAVYSGQCLWQGAGILVVMAGVIVSLGYLCSTGLKLSNRGKFPTRPHETISADA